MQLKKYRTEFDRGAPRIVEALWYLLEGGLLSSIVPGSAWRAALLRLFGARIGKGVVLKPRLRVKFPWRLSIGDHVWLGEAVWIDNLAQVSVGHDSCISQGAYLCTGNHDWRKEGFDLRVSPIEIGDHCWVGAMAKLGPGCVVESGTVVSLGSVVSGRLQAWGIYSGAPASRISERSVEYER